MIKKLMVGWIAMALGMMACGLTRPKPQSFVIPVYDTAEEQFRFAEKYYTDTLPSIDPERRREQMLKAIACFNKVVERFPDDEEWTPLALIWTGDVYYKSKDFEDAIKYYERARENYPNYDYVQIKALWAEGKSLELMSNYDQAHQMHREVLDRYEERKDLDSASQFIVKDCRSLYERVLSE